MIPGGAGTGPWWYGPAAEPRSPIVGGYCPGPHENGVGCWWPKVYWYPGPWPHPWGSGGSGTDGCRYGWWWCVSCRSGSGGDNARPTPRRPSPGPTSSPLRRRHAGGGSRPPPSSPRTGEFSSSSSSSAANDPSGKANGSDDSSSWNRSRCCDILRGCCCVGCGGGGCTVVVMEEG